MTTNLVILPLVLPVLTALMLLLVGRSRFWRRWLAGVSMLVQLTVALGLVAVTYQLPPLMMPASGWAAPFGIVLVIDQLTALMLALGAMLALAAINFGFAEMPTQRTHPLRAPLIQFMMTGINLSFITGDLFNLFVGFEVMLIASYALLTLEADDFDIRQAFPYLAINLFGSTIFLVAAGFAYTIFGSLNFAQIALIGSQMAGDPRITVLGLLLLLVFGLKSGLFPLYYWLPNSYPILPAPVAALYAGLLTKVGVYVMIRVFGQVLPPDLTLVYQCLGWMAAATMIFGALGAISRNSIRGILSFQVITSIGSIALAVSFFTEYAFTAAIFYVLQDIMVKSSLFLIGGAVGVLNDTDNIERTGGLWKAAPLLGVLFLLQAFALAGLPPLSGFWGKYMIVTEGARLGHWLYIACVLIAGLLTTFSMLRIWLTTFWRDEAEAGGHIDHDDLRWKPMTIIIAVMTLVSLGFGLGADRLLQLSAEASHQIFDRAAYIQHILEVRP